MQVQRIRIEWCGRTPKYYYVTTNKRLYSEETHKNGGKGKVFMGETHDGYFKFRITPRAFAHLEIILALEKRCGKYYHNGICCG